MYSRVTGLSVGFSILAAFAGACGGDDSPGSTPASLMCAPNMQSTPGAADDPCPQNTPQCPSLPGQYVGAQAACNTAGCRAITTCQADMRWSPMCMCIPNGPPATDPVAGAGGGMIPQQPPGPVCGNGMVETGEQCEANVAITASCASLGMGTGMLTCDPATCMFDTQMCAPDSMTGGSGG
jgi:hypothetical protein